MPIIPQWENNDRTIMTVQFSGKWAWNEFSVVRTTILDMVDSIPHCVDYIINFEDEDDIPAGALAIGRSIHKSCSLNQGIIVIVGISPMLRMLYQSFTLAYPATIGNFILVATIDDAYETITEIQQYRNNK